MAKRKTVEEIDAAIARWQTKLKRAVNTIDRLRKQRLRADKATLRKTLEAQLKEAKPKTESIPASTLVAAVKSHIARGLAAPEKVMVTTEEWPAFEREKQKAAEIDTAIPDFLQRDKKAAEEIKAGQAEISKRKAAGRIAKMKAKQRGDLKKMPLTGKAALAAIRDADDEEDWRTSRDER